MAHLSEEELGLLQKLFLFDGMSRAAVWAMASDKGCHVSQAEKGETIYTPHDFSRALGVILSGKARVSREGFVVSVLERGDVFGAAALYNSQETYATTITARAPCRVVFFSQDLMSHTMAYHVAVAGNYIRYLSGRIRFLEGKLDGLLAPNTERKLAQYLLEHREGEGVTLDCPLSGLASRLDVSRASLYRAFDALTEAGAIEKDGKLVRILKEDILL